MTQYRQPETRQVRFSGFRRTLAWLGTIALIGTAVAGCDGSRAEKPDAMTSYSGDPASADQAKLFTVPPEQMAHLQLTTIEPKPLTRMLRLTGTVAFNGFATTPVITQVSGPVSRIVVSPGQMVRRGQALLYVSSPDYSQLRAAYIKARDAFDLADKNYLRSKDLYDHHAIAERDLQAAASVRNQAQADLQASEQALRILGLSHPDAVVKSPPSPEIPLLAPIGGEVVERLIAPGQFIQAGTTQCFTISNMSTVWVLANVYQRDLPFVHVGDPVVITSDSSPGTDFHGKISYIAAALDPNTRTLQARIEVKNPQEKLKKDMYVFALVRAGTVRDAISVPNAAVLRTAENEPFVYVRKGDNQFERRLVGVGETTEAETQITRGLTPGEQVVGDGSLFLQFANSLQR